MGGTSRTIATEVHCKRFMLAAVTAKNVARKGGNAKYRILAHLLSGGIQVLISKSVMKTSFKLTWPIRSAPSLPVCWIARSFATRLSSSSKNLAVSAESGRRK